MRVLRRGDERVEIELVDTTVTVRRFAADALIGTSSKTYESLLRAKFRADIACSQQRAAGFELAGRELVVALSHAELMAAIDASPNDHDTRLVLADWLTERGDPWGQIIAIQLQKEHTTDGDRYDELDLADFELRIAHKSRLWGELAEITVDAGRERVLTDTMHAEWECGFVRELMLDSPRVDLGPVVVDAIASLDVTRLLRMLYVTHLDPSSRLVERLAAHSWPHLLELHVAVDYEDLVDPGRLVPLLAAGCLPSVEVLAFAGIRSADPFCHALARSPLAPRLRTLALLGSEFTAAGIAELATAPFDRLETLHVTGAGPEDAHGVLRDRAKRVTVELVRHLSFM